IALGLNFLPGPEEGRVENNLFTVRQRQRMQRNNAGTSGQRSQSRNEQDNFDFRHSSSCRGVKTGNSQRSPATKDSASPVSPQTECAPRVGRQSFTKADESLMKL